MTLTDIWLRICHAHRRGRITDCVPTLGRDTITLGPVAIVGHGSGYVVTAGRLHVPASTAAEAWRILRASPDCPASLRGVEL
jgi:hypothetical protein